MKEIDSVIDNTNYKFTMSEKLKGSSIFWFLKFIFGFRKKYSCTDFLKFVFNSQNCQKEWCKVLLCQPYWGWNANLI